MVFLMYLFKGYKFEFSTDEIFVTTPYGTKYKLTMRDNDIDFPFYFDLVQK